MKTAFVRLLIITIVAALGVGIAWLAGGDSHRLAGAPLLLWCALVAFGSQWLAAIPAIIRKTESFYDLAGSLAYLSLVALAVWSAWSHQTLSLVSWIVAGMVAVWALRLGTFLVRRIHKAGKDDRFNDIKQSPTRFLIAWTLQGLWVFLTMLPALLLLTHTPALTRPGWLTWLGWGLWLVGFSIEVIADAQKSAFNAAPENKGRWIDTGLWKYSQHPNYFGEILLWTGIFVSGIGVYQGWQWLAALSPLFVYVLLTKGSGIPLLDKRAMEKWGDEPGYLAYRERTNVLLPGPTRPGN